MWSTSEADQMTDKDLKVLAKITLIAGAIRVLGDQLYSIFGIKGVYYVFNASAQVMMWFVLNKLFEKLKWNFGIVGINVFFFYSISALIDEAAFDPSKPQGNEFVFAIFVLIWAFRRYKKLNNTP